MAVCIKPPSPLKKRIFISYGHEELGDLIERLKADLVARCHEVWIDVDMIKLGGDWEQSIEKGLEWASEGNTGLMVLLMTPRSVRRPDGYCLNEVARAIQHNLPIIPIMVQMCEPPLSICRIQWLDMQDCMPLAERVERYNAKFSLLAQAIEQDKLEFEGFQSSLFKSLKPLSFDADIRLNLDHFIGREWVFGEVDRWLSSGGTRIFWIMGGPGTGKTSISAWLCANRPEIAAFHFCSYDNVQKIDPRRCIMSIAYQLSTQLPDYDGRLRSINLDEAKDLNAKALFDNLIVQPLAGIENPSRQMVILIDALDEATFNGKNELAGFLASEFERTPEWLKLVITSRPDPEVMGTLQAYSPFTLSIDDLRNRQDIHAFLARELKAYYNGGRVPEYITNVIAMKCEGLFLYADWVLRELKLGRLSLDRLDEFPKGLGGIYLKFFQRQFSDVGAWESGVRPVLEVLSALQEPIGIKDISSIFKWSIHDERKFRRSMGSLFRFDGGIVHPFHKSLMEWLTNEDKDDPYFASTLEGHKILAEEGMKRFRSSAGTWPPYVIMYLPLHLYMAERLDELREILGNLKFVRAMWEKDSFNALKQWTFIEERSPVRMADIHRPIIDDPERENEKDLIALARVLRNMYHPDEAFKILEYLKGLYQGTGDSSGLQEVLDSLAWILTNKSNFKAAMALLKEEERLCRGTGNMNGLQYALLNQAHILHYVNDFDNAMRILKEQEEISKTIGNLDALQESKMLQGLILRVSGNFEGALAMARDEERLCRETGNLNGIQESLWGQAQALRQLGKLNEALGLFREDEAICRKIGNKEFLQAALRGQSFVLGLRGDLDQALSLVKESERICRELGNKFSLGEAIDQEAFIQRMKGDPDGAMALFTIREQICQELGDRYGLQHSYGNQAVILRLKGALGEALALHKEEERICREIGHKRDLAMSLSNQAVVLRMKGDLDDAARLHDEAEKMLRKMGYKYGLQECIGEKALTLCEMGDADVALVLLKEQEQLCRDMGLKLDLEKCLARQKALDGCGKAKDELSVHSTAD